MIEIFGTPSCTFCRRAKSMCENNDLEYVYRDLTEEPGLRSVLEERIGSSIRTVPQIFYDGVYVEGGFQGLSEKIMESD